MLSQDLGCSHREALELALPEDIASFCPGLFYDLGWSHREAPELALPENIASFCLGLFHGLGCSHREALELALPENTASFCLGLFYACSRETRLTQEHRIVLPTSVLHLHDFGSVSIQILNPTPDRSVL